jgi:hypothetical protein
MATPQEIAAAAAEKSKKLAEDKAKSEAQKKLEEISKGRSLTEDGTDLTAPIYLNIDPTTLKWEDSIRYFVWNRFIDYLRNRNLTKKDLKGNPTPLDEFTPTLNTGENAKKTQEFLNDFNNNYIFKKRISVIEHTNETYTGIDIKTGKPVQKLRPTNRTSKTITFDEFLISSKYGKLTVDDVREAQKYQAITNPIGSTTEDGRKNEVKIDSIIGTQTYQMSYPTRILLYDSDLDNEFIESIKDAFNPNTSPKPTIRGVNYLNQTISYYSNSSVPKFQLLTKAGNFESSLPSKVDLQPDLYYRLIWGNKRYVISTEYVYNTIKNLEDTNPEEVKYLLGNLISTLLSDRSKWILYSPKYENKLRGTVSKAWGTPVGPNWDTIPGIQAAPNPQSTNETISKNKIKSLKLKSETQLKTKITEIVKK